MKQAPTVRASKASGTNFSAEDSSFIERGGTMIVYVVQTLTLTVKLLEADHGGILGLCIRPGIGLTLGQAMQLAWGVVASGSEFGDVGGNTLYDSTRSYMEAAYAHPDGEADVIAVHAEHPRGEKKEGWGVLKGNEALSYARRAAWGAKYGGDGDAAATAHAQWQRSEKLTCDQIIAGERDAIRETQLAKDRAGMVGNPMLEAIARGGY